MKMRYKTLLGAAGLAACSLTHAQTITMYGTVFQFFDNAKTTGATNGIPADKPAQVPGSAYTGLSDLGRNRISAGTSNLGWRGSEELGGNLKAVFQLETAFSVDGSPGPGWASRNSMIGLQGSWGTVSMGQWDTPYKFISLPVNAVRIGYQADYTPLMGNPGMGVPATTTAATRVPGKPDAAFDRRQGNEIQYWTPVWGGFTARFMYSVNEGRTTATATAPSISPSVASMALAYEMGPVSLRYAYEQHDDYFGMSQLGGSAAATLTNSGSKDKANKFIAQWKILPTTRIAGIFEQLDYHNDDSVSGAVQGYKRRAFYVFGEHKMANNTFWLAYGRAEDGSCGKVGGGDCSTKDLGADYVSGGWVYNFSMRTQILATYYKVSNKASGTYTVQPSVGPIIAPGADTIGFGVGLAMIF